MNEELQNKIAQAIQKLSEGAPEFWEALIAEAQMRAGLSLVICLVIFVFSSITLFIAARKMNWQNATDPMLVVIMISSFIALVSGAFSGINAADYVSPSLHLLKML